jgi:hypothetical protein
MAQQLMLIFGDQKLTQVLQTKLELLIGSTILPFQSKTFTNKLLEPLRFELGKDKVEVGAFYFDMSDRQAVAYLNENLLSILHDFQRVTVTRSSKDPCINALRPTLRLKWSQLEGSKLINVAGVLELARPVTSSRGWWANLFYQIRKRLPIGKRPLPEIVAEIVKSQLKKE